MKRLLNSLFALFASLFILAVPASAGTVDLQLESRLYTVKSGMALTEEEQRFMDYVTGYFTDYPDQPTLTVTSDDFPSLSAEWVNETVLEKIDWETSHYAINLTDTAGSVCCLIEYPIRCTDSEGSAGDITATISNDRFGYCLQLKQFLDHTYSLLPDLGITDGMDERDAVAILNRWECDYLTKKESSWARLLTIYEHRGGLCMDYAYMFRALCRGAGIDAYTLTSVPGDHAWNEVIIDGQSYEVDVFWNDLSTMRDIFLLTREQCSRISHHREISYRD